MISTAGLMVFGVIIFYQFVLYWIAIFSTYLSATQNIEEENNLWTVISEAEDIWFWFWVRSLIPFLMFFFFLYLRSIGL